MGGKRVIFHFIYLTSLFAPCLWVGKPSLYALSELCTPSDHWKGAAFHTLYLSELFASLKAQQKSHFTRYLRCLVLRIITKESLYALSQLCTARQRAGKDSFGALAIDIQIMFLTCSDDARSFGRPLDATKLLRIPKFQMFFWRSIANQKSFSSNS